MEREETKVKGLSEIRFSRIIFLLRFAGIPFKMKKIPTVYVIYIITVIMCTGNMFLGLFVDMCIHWNDLGHVMTNLRMLTGMISVLWIYLSCR